MNKILLSMIPICLLASSLVTYAVTTTTITTQTQQVKPLALDGSTNNFKYYDEVTCKLTTSNPLDIIIVYIIVEARTLTSISDTNLLAWHQRSVQFFTYPSHIFSGYQYEYWAVAPTPLSSDIINMTTSGNSYFWCMAFGVSNADTITPFDVNSPAMNWGFGQATGNVTLSTTNPNDMLMTQGFAFRGITSIPTGFTQIQGYGSQQGAYEIVNVPQDKHNIVWYFATPDNGGTTSTVWAIMADAVKAKIVPCSA